MLKTNVLKLQNIRFQFLLFVDIIIKIYLKKHHTGRLETDLILGVLNFVLGLACCSSYTA